MSRIAFPYPTLYPHIPKDGIWEAKIDDRIRLFKDGSGSWDYDSTFTMTCRLSWTPAHVFEEAGLAGLLDGARLAVVLATGSSDGTGRRFVATDIPVLECDRQDDNEGATLRIELDSPQLCSRIRASLYIYAPEAEVGGIRVRKGSVLYSEHASLQLEGDLASFPIRSLSFTASGLGDGLWLVDCSAESAEDPLLSSVTLLLNSERQTFIDQMQAEPVETGLLRWIVRADVMASVLSYLLMNEEFGFDPSFQWPEGSIGAVASSWLRSLGIEGDAALRRIADEIRREPGRFRQRCQAACTPPERTV
jgi:hypothetical protein